MMDLEFIVQGISDHVRVLTYVNSCIALVKSKQPIWRRGLPNNLKSNWRQVISLSRLRFPTLMTSSTP